jgi:phosphonate transport system permease protein
MTGVNLALNLIFTLLFAVSIYGLLTIDTKGTDIAKAGMEAIQNFVKMFTGPVPSHFSYLEGVNEVLVTLALAFLTTVLGAVIALILGLLAAKNLSNETVSNVIKGFISFIRAVPTVLWVLIFAIGAGLGSVAAVIGMSFHTIGYLTKAYSESFEELDDGVVEALKASGATWIQIVFQAVLPSSITCLLSWTFFRFEVNFAVAVAMGAAAGAGGIGYQLYMASGYFFDIREIGYITYLILAIALLMEVFALWLKSKYHIHE